MVLAKSLKNKDGEDGEKVGSRSASDAILSPGPGGRLAAAGGGFAVARNLVRIFSSDWYYKYSSIIFLILSEG